MYDVKNLFDNKSLRVAYEMGPVCVLEHLAHYSSNDGAASSPLYDNINNVRCYQALIELRNSAFTVSAGAMQWTLGDVEMTTGGGGVAGFAKKLFAGAVTGESAVKPTYSGKGLLMLEPTSKFLFPIDVSDWGTIVLDDGMFLGCDANLSMEVRRNGSLTNLASGEGLFNVTLSGQGVALVESKRRYEQLVTVELHNDVLRVDGPLAVAWSGSLDFSVEKSSKSILSSVSSGEGLVNVYRGTGKVMMAIA